MSGKTFAFFVVIVLLIVGGAVLSLMDSGGSTDPVVIGDDPEKAGGATTGGSAGPSAVVPKDPESGQAAGAGMVRETATSGDPDFDFTGELTISGRVIDARTEKGLEGAEVNLHYPDGDPFQSAVTGADGRYKISVSEGIPPIVDLRAWADSYATQAKPGHAVSKANRNLTVDFELRRWFTIEGRVISMDGKAVDDATVEIRSLLPMYEDDWDDGDTDGNGFYRIEEIEDLPRTGFDVWVTSSGYIPLVKSNLSVPEDSDVLRVDFEVYPSLVISGVVVSATDRRPIEDAEIAVTSKDPEFVDDGEEEITEEDGTFQMELDTVPYEGLFILIAAEGHSAVEIKNVPAPTAKGEIFLGEIMMPQVVRVTGVVVNKMDGRPVPGGDITIYARGAPDLNDGDYCDCEFINELGRFEVDLEMTPPQSAEVYVEADGFFPLRKRLDIPPGALQQEIRLEVEPMLKLRGVVRRKADGTPVAGARVRLIAPDGTVNRESMVARTRANGLYLIDLPSGSALNYAIVIEYMDKRFPEGNLPTPPPGQYEIEQDFVVDLPPMGGRR